MFRLVPTLDARVCRSLLVLAALTGAPSFAQSGPPEAFLENLSYRELGPPRGGRSAAVCGLAAKRDTFYFGATGGGVFKTQDGGRSWENVSDGSFGGSIGAVAVSEWDPNVVYVGGGEKTLRGNVSHGDGVHKSTDAGRTWTFVGLPDSHHISRLRIHPRDPDLVYAAVMGHLYGPNEERGVYRTRDGGKTWERILFTNEHAGCVDLAMDPNNARILYACFWRVRRTPYSLESGGEGSRIFKTVDGGDTWEDLTDAKGLPDGLRGISGVSVSPTNSDNVYLILESDKGGVFRSRDGGESWSRTNDDRSLRQRAWYYTRIVADPASEENVYVLNVGFHHSRDGGKTFSRISVPHGDNHDLWIDPADPERMIQSNDGGANVSYDGGETWSTQENQPTSQIYRISTDTSTPYRVLGAQQDNSAFRILSKPSRGRITDRDWEPTAGGESGHIVAHPEDPDLVYGGSYGGLLMWRHHRTQEARIVNVWPENPMGAGAEGLPYRFQWNFPIFFSPHEPYALYAAANVLFRSEDGGGSWTPISPDLTRNDKSKQGSSGGPITKDNTSVEYYCTIFAAAESHHEKGVLWCGSDDGLLYLSQDDGASWSNVTPTDMPEWAQINCIDVHPTEPGGLYVAATRYKLDDFEPSLYKTSDYGASWTRIDTGIERDHFTRVLRADPDRPGLLYAGTERGLYVSFDDGTSWQSMQGDLPVSPVTDLQVKEKDLVVATQGRGIWILDDLTPLQQWKPEITAARSHLFRPRATVRGSRGARASFRIWLADLPEEKELCTLEILDGDGHRIQKMKARRSERGTSGARRRGGGSSSLLLSETGLVTASWNLRYEGAESFPGMILWSGGTTGPIAVPGTYTARFTLGDQTQEVPFEVRKDPRSRASLEDMQRQFDFLVAVRDKLSEAHVAIRQLRAVRSSFDRLKKDAQRFAEGDEEVAARDLLFEQMKQARETLDEVEKALYQTKNKSRQDPLNFPIRLNDKLAGLMRVAGTGDLGPTAQAEEVRVHLTKQIDAELARLESVLSEEVPAINELASKLSIPAVSLPETKSTDDEE